jgi:hypothetical protein
MQRLFRRCHPLDAALREQRAQGRRLDRLAEHPDLVTASLFAHPFVAVGRDEDCSETGAETAA